MADKSQKDLDRVVNHFQKKGVHMDVTHSDKDPHSWELESIENKSDIHGAGSEALQHLAMTADKHKKHIFLLPAGAPGKEKHLTDYYGRHGFKAHPQDKDIMHRPPGAKMNLGEGAAGSHKSRYIVKCPSCDGKKKGPACKRCGGSGKLEGNVKLPLNKQNTGVESRRAWIKEGASGWRKKMMAKMKKQKLAEEEQPKQYVVKAFHGKDKPYYNQKRTVSNHNTEASARKAAKKITGADKVTIQAFDGSKWRLLEDGVPANAMGMSSSTPGTGGIDTYDPLLDLGGGKVKSKLRKKLFDMMRRKLQEK